MKKIFVLVAAAIMLASCACNQAKPVEAAAGCQCDTCQCDTCNCAAADTLAVVDTVVAE